MKNCLLFITALVMISLNSLSQELPTNMFIEIPMADYDIVVDGIDDDEQWGLIEGLAFEYTFQDAMPSETDFSANIKFVWSELGLLMFAKITDDQINGMGPDDENEYEQDNLELFTFFGEDGLWGAEGEEGAGGSSWSQIRIQLTDDEETLVTGNYQGTWSAPETGIASEGKLETVAKVTEDGWDVEAIWPWAMFDMFYQPALEMAFGLEVTLGDADEALRDNQLSLMNDSKVDVAWDDKRYIGTAILGDAPEVISINNKTNAAILAYPTITSDFVNLTESADVTVFNALGQKVLSKKHTNSIDLSGLNNGLYFIKAKGTNSRIIKK